MLTFEKICVCRRIFLSRFPYAHFLLPVLSTNALSHLILAFLVWRKAPEMPGLSTITHICCQSELLFFLSSSMVRCDSFHGTFVSSSTIVLIRLVSRIGKWKSETAPFWKKRKDDDKQFHVQLLTEIHNVENDLKHHTATRWTDFFFWQITPAPLIWIRSNASKIYSQTRVLFLVSILFFVNSEDVVCPIQWSADPKASQERG